MTAGHAGRVGRAAAELVRWGLAGYAQVLFDTRVLVGVLAAAATFVSPAHGLAGLLGLVGANLAAWLLELDPVQRRAGFYAFNGLLTGLALGLYFRLNVPFAVALLLGGAVVAALAAGLRSLFERLLGVPVLSVPFLLGSWLLYAAAERLPGLEVTLGPTEVGLGLGALLPVWLDEFLRALAAIFFQLSALSGVFVALALLAWSRLAFLLGVVGYVASKAALLALGEAASGPTGALAGFNAILAAIAVAGVWTVPTARAFLLAAVVGAVTALVATSAAVALPRLGVPVLAFPFLATTLVVLLALRSRPAPRRLLQPAVSGGTPETTLRDYVTRRERFAPADRLGVPLPVVGRWRVTQAFDGLHTHRAAWRHGLDLEAVDEDGFVFRGSGAANEDFYSFGLPVFAPLAGRVVAVVAHLPDSPVGEADPEHPFGNTVVLWHGGLAYTALSHLQRGSVVVEPGMEVLPGAVLGRVGSSGRSPSPHLHLQVQASPEVGAPTVPWTLLHWLMPDADGRARYETHGLPPEEAVVESLLPSPTLSAALAFPLGQRWRFLVRTGDGREVEETWSAALDFESRLWLVSAPSGARLRLWRSPFVVLAEDYEGPADTALRRLYEALPRVPLADRDGLRWRDRLPADTALSWGGRLVADVLRPFVTLARLETESELGTGPDGRRVLRTVSRLRRLGVRRATTVAHEVHIDALHGVVRLEERRPGAPLWTATLALPAPVAPPAPVALDEEVA